MKKANYIIFDCETGGLDKEKNPITQIALLTLDSTTLEELDRFEFFIAPYDDLVITKKSLEMTGLKMKDIEAGYSKKDAVTILIDYFKSSMPAKHPSNRPVMIGHNVPFDLGMVGSLFERDKKDLYNYINDSHIDTMTLAKMYDPAAALDSLALGNVCKWFDIELKSAHRAMPDVVATTKLFKTLTVMLRDSTAGVELDDKVKKKRETFQF